MATTTDLPLKPGRWEMDPIHSTVAFTVRHLGVTRVHGRFTEFTTEVVVGETLETTSVEAVIQLASIESGSSQRDDDVRGPNFLDVENNPTLTFRSTSIEGSGNRGSMTGDLTYGSITRPVTLEVELGGVLDVPGADQRRAGFAATGEVRRSDFKVAPGTPTALVGDVVKIEIDLQLIEPGD